MPCALQSPASLRTLSASSGSSRYRAGGRITGTAIYHSLDEIGSYRISERCATGEDLRKHIENPDPYPYPHLGRVAETLDFSNNAQWVRAVVRGRLR